MKGAIIVAAGIGKRVGNYKQFLYLGGKPILIHALEKFQKNKEIDDLYLLVPEERIDYCTGLMEDYNLNKIRKIIAGGKERQDSVMIGLESIEEKWDIVLIHDGVRPFVNQQIIHEVLKEAEKVGAAIAAVPVIDTIKVSCEGQIVRETLNRNQLWQVQTPQAFKYSVIKEAYKKAWEEKFIGIDDASLVERLSLPVKIVMGSYKNIKITTPEDLVIAESLIQDEDLIPPNPPLLKGGKGEFLEENSLDTRVGHGYDCHRLVDGRKLILGGVEIPFERGLEGHSDADVLVHAICDALLGAVGDGDIGRHFPDSDESYKGISSLKLLSKIGDLVKLRGFYIGNIDSTIIAQRPKLLPFLDGMRENIAMILGISRNQVNVKAKTAEGMGFLGAGEGMASHAVCIIKRRITYNL